MGVGSGGGGQSPSILKFDIFILILQKCYSLNFGLVKIKVHHCYPLAKILLDTPCKNPLLPTPGKNLSDANVSRS